MSEEFSLVTLRDITPVSNPCLLGVGLVQGMEVRFETLGLTEPAIAHSEIVVANNKRISIPVLTLVRIADDMIAIAPFEVEFGGRVFLLAALIDCNKFFEFRGVTLLKDNEANAEIWGPFSSADAARDFLMEHFKNNYQKRIGS